MTMLDVTIEVHDVDDVTFMLDTDVFLDAIGAVDRKAEDALNDALEAYVDEHASYGSERWYCLLHHRDPHDLLRAALTSALGVDPDDARSDYGWCTCNWENILSQDVGGSLWDLADGRRYLTIESGEAGLMHATVGVRSVVCDEPAYVIETCSRWVMLGCATCDYSIDMAHEPLAWARLTRCDAEGWPLARLFCPRCGDPMVAEVRI